MLHDGALPKIRIKKDYLSKNEYIWADGVWVRNFNKRHVTPIDLNNLYDLSDLPIITLNETANLSLNHANIAKETINFDKAVIISDGYQFDIKHKILEQLPKDVIILAVNRSLAKWELLPGKENHRPINVYVNNNPYECLHYLPKNKYYPTCITSYRTHHQFVKNYKGNIRLYAPTISRGLGSIHHENYFIDDYRNPICAAIGLSFQFGIKQLMLFCCDESFKDKRDAAIQLHNGLWTYPQHITSQKIIDANLFWFNQRKEHKIKIGNHSNGIEYKNAEYINSVDDVISFFQEEL
jgi:hypothetical protein